MTKAKESKKPAQVIQQEKKILERTYVHQSDKPDGDAPDSRGSDDSSGSSGDQETSSGSGDKETSSKD